MLCLLLPALSVEAQIFKRDPGDEIIQAEEEKLELPAAPKDENLLPFDPGFVTSLSFYVDSASLKVGDDRIVRYTLVIKSPSGAANATYEGLRCDTIERKVYAYGSPDGSWSAARNPQWQPLGKEIHRHTLFNDFFCPRTVVVGGVREAIRLLKSGGHPRIPPS